MSHSAIYFIERLSFGSLCRHILPFVFVRRSTGLKGRIKLYFIDATRPGIAAARVVSVFLGVDLEKFAFRLMDFKGAQNLSPDLKVIYFDLAKVQEEVLKNTNFGPSDERFKVYLKKQLALHGLKPGINLYRAVFLIQIIREQLEKEQAAENTFFMRRRAWADSIIAYGRTQSVNIICAGDDQFDFKTYFKNLAGERLHFWRNVYFHAFKDGWKKEKFEKAETGPNLAVEYYGHLNLNEPHLYSDLFFLQPSQMAPEDIWLLFHLPQDPLDNVKKEILLRHGIKSLALKPKAVKKTDAAVFYNQSSKEDIHLSTKETESLKPAERKWAKELLNSYSAEVNYWRDLFKRTQSKAYLSWHMNSPQHCAIAEGIRQAGGVMAIYQRSYQEFPSVLTAVAADVAFCFSPKNFALEKKSGSAIDWHVAVGYSGDHRFKRLKPYARAIREQLEKSGAERIMAYFDENSHDDDRWYPGHTIARQNYTFLLEKVLNDPSLGLVIKPKTPSSLIRRLGPVAYLLKQAKSTGRCFVFEQGALHGAYPPATAALAADFAIHGHLCAATAGLESALAGVPTVLMDFEGWGVSDLYKQGAGKFAFADWEEFWAAALRYWQNPREASGFGDWSTVLNELDPFRDGRSAERIGTYLKWVLDGFKTGLSREAVLLKAAERYADQWGRDKIQSALLAPQSNQPELVAS